MSKQFEIGDIVTFLEGTYMSRRFEIEKVFPEGYFLKFIGGRDKGRIIGGMLHRQLVLVRNKKKVVLKCKHSAGWFSSKVWLFVGKDGKRVVFENTFRKSGIMPIVLTCNIPKCGKTKKFYIRAKVVTSRRNLI